MPMFQHGDTRLLDVPKYRAACGEINAAIQVGAVDNTFVTQREGAESTGGLTAISRLATAFLSTYRWHQWVSSLSRHAKYRAGRR